LPGSVEGGVVVLVVLDVGVCVTVLLRVVGEVFESTTRVRGVAGIAELVLGAVLGILTPGVFEGVRMVRDVPEEASAAPVPREVRALRAVRSLSEPVGATRLPRAL
jgi:hypothetical protein